MSQKDQEKPIGSRPPKARDFMLNCLPCQRGKSGMKTKTKDTSKRHLYSEVPSKAGIKPTSAIPQRSRAHHGRMQEPSRSNREPNPRRVTCALRVGHTTVQRVMVDGGSSADILCLDAYRRMGLDVEEIKRSNPPLVRFDGKRVSPICVITLSVKAADRTIKVEFIVIDSPLAYNAIMGHEWIHRMEGVPSTLHQVMRCLTKDGRSTIDIRGDQLATRKCYALACRTPEGPTKGSPSTTL
ncbi:hypothetical protein QJS10_CPB13g01126 [Acorus calamus]|uniref:Gag-pol polyprotein n=1 Tax=Acorus calamus TaxID=4465 RepID=A0AAV9DE60_ACOCL|nr:hypothetical protein QJS10_CPB13g01126 [Acorus calamus]